MDRTEHSNCEPSPAANLIPVTTLDGEVFEVPRAAFAEFPSGATSVQYNIESSQGKVGIEITQATNTDGLSGLNFKFINTEQEPKFHFVDDKLREALLRNQEPGYTHFSAKYLANIDQVKDILTRSLGFSPSALGVQQLDIYCSKSVGAVGLSSIPLIGPKFRESSAILRIRIEGGRYLISEKDPLATYSHSSKWQRNDIEISEDQFKILMKDKTIKEIARVEKIRDIYTDNHGTVVCLDNVLHHGDFIEIRGNSNESLKNIADSLGLSSSSRAANSYLDMSLNAAFPKWKVGIIRFHRKFGELVQGIVSGTLTPLGFLATAAVVDPSFKNLFSALCAAAVCDGAGDSLAVAKAARSELNGTWKDAINAGLKTFAGKVVMPSTFLPIALFSPPHLIPTMSVAWASLVLGLISAEQAIATARSVRDEVLFSIIGAIGVTAASVGAGTIIENFLR